MRLNGKLSDLPFRLMAVRPYPRGQRPANFWENVRDFVLVSLLAAAIVAAMCLPLVGSVAFATNAASATFESLPQELKSLPLPQRTYMEAADGTRIATLYEENRVVVPLSEISPTFQRAIIDTEDARFYEHKGVDVKAAVRAMVANNSSGDVQQGSSTITMQYVRNLLITNASSKEEIEAARARTIGRKIQEMRYALALEKKLSKEQILEGYLNVAYFGGGAYGVEAAARHFFSVSAKDLDLVQSATLAGLVQNPVGYDPTLNPRLSEVRRNVVLDNMVLAGDITEKQASQAKIQNIKGTLKITEQANGCTASAYPFYCDFVLHQIRNDPRYGATKEERDELLRRGGLVIHTALDLTAQKAAHQAVNNAIPPTDPSKKAAAIAMVEPGTGDVLALAENREWGTSGAGKTTYNYAVDAADGGTIGMQAGSTFKIFTLAAALERGMSPREYIDAPQRRTFSDSDWGCKEDLNQPPYTVNNSTGAGRFNMWQATAYSINTYFVELQRRAGLCRTVDVAERMGVKLGNGQPLQRYPSFTLGSMEVSPLRLAAAYATVANHGIYCRPHAVLSINALDGTEMYADSGDCTRAIERDVADAVTALLTGVIDGNISGRTGAQMSLGRDAAGKTGTTDSNAAVWFAGFTPQIAAAVWVGDPRGGFKYPMQGVTINGRYYSKVHGSSLPGPIWRNAMQAALADKEAKSFDLEAKFNLQTARDGGVNGGSSSAQYDPDYGSGNSYNYNPYYNNYYNYYNYNGGGGNNDNNGGGNRNRNPRLTEPLLPESDPATP